MESHSARPRTVMLVSNPCVNDSRVIRAAEVVSDLGHEVIVLAAVTNDQIPDERRNGVLYRRLRLNHVLLPHHFFGSGRPRSPKRGILHTNYTFRHWFGIREEHSAPIKKSRKNKPRRSVQRFLSWNLGKILPKRDSAWSNRLTLDLSNRLSALHSDLVSTMAPKFQALDKRYRDFMKHNPIANRAGKAARELATSFAGTTNAVRLTINDAGLAIKTNVQKFATELRRSTIVVESASVFRVEARRTAKILRRIPESMIRSTRFVATKTRGTALRHFAFVVEVNRLNDAFLKELVSLSPDVIHAHDLSTLPAATAAASQIKAKVIYDSHELEVHRNMVASRFSCWMRRRIEAKHIRKTSAVVTVCDSIADHLATEYLIPRPLVVMNAPDVTRVHKFERDLRADIGLSKDTPLAVYIGRITLGRGIEECVKALPHWPGHIALVGPVHPPTVTSARSLASELNVADRLHVMPPVAPNSVTSYVRTADISLVAIQNVCLSYYYCLPNKLIESALAGLPVVVSNFPELRRFVEISGAGLVMDERDPLDIAQALIDAYEHRDKLKSSRDQLKRVEAIYGWSTQKRALEELYRSFGLPSQVQKRRTKKRVAGGKVALAQAANKADYSG